MALSNLEAQGLSLPSAPHATNKFRDMLRKNQKLPVPAHRLEEIPSSTLSSWISSLLSEAQSRQAEIKQALLALSDSKLARVLSSLGDSNESRNKSEH